MAFSGIHEEATDAAERGIQMVLGGEGAEEVLEDTGDEFSKG